MNQHIEILRRLQRPEHVSGLDLSQRIGISPSAVRRSVEVLRSLGFEIAGLRGRGYRLTETLEFLDENRLRSELLSAGLLTADRLEVLDTVESTSTRLAEWQNLEDLHGRACVAEYQSRGRGRRGRSWLGVPCRNIMLSMAWMLNRRPDQVVGLSLSVGLVLIRRFRDLGVPGLQLKWPNDVVCDCGKLAGILVDVLSRPSDRCIVVVGIGVNLFNPASIESQLERPVANLSDLCEVRVDRTGLVAMILADLNKALEAFDYHGFADQATDWNTYDAYEGLRVQGQIDGRSIEGWALGVDASGAYRIAVGSREVESILAGEIILKPVDRDTRDIRSNVD